MSKVAVPVLLSITLLAACAHRPPIRVTPHPDAVMATIAATYWQAQMDASPTWASYLGKRSYDDKLPDVSAKARARYNQKLRKIQESLVLLDVSQLSPHARISTDVLKSRLNLHFSDELCRDWNWVVDQLNGPQVWLGEIPSYHVIDGPERASTLLTRYRSINTLIRDHISNLRSGLRDEWVASRINVTRVIEQLDTLLGTPSHQSPFVATVLKKASGKIPENFSKQLNQVVASHVYPALQSYRDFLAKEVSPKSRAAVGVNVLPGGGECYDARIKKHTGLELAADQIHRLGLTEVARIKAEMQQLVAEMGGTDVEAFLADLAGRPDQHLNSRSELLDYNRQLVERARRMIPQIVGRQPKTPVILKPIESFRERDAPAAYYYSAPPDGSRPAAYYLNTYAPETRLLYKMAALAFHEALPGHHLQIALAGENTALPTFMRHGGQTAFVEGWALYSEGLAAEFGLYETPEEKLGALTYEIWRAARLVIDTGLHAKGWSRQRAIDYLALHTGHDPGEVINEIDRYIIWPGQALAYKMGQLEISRLRAEVEDTLGDGFDLRAFHDQVLRNGALPMDVLRQVIARWLGRTQK